MDRPEWVQMEWTQKLIKQCEEEVTRGCEAYINGEFIGSTVDETAMMTARAQAIAMTFRELIRIIKEDNDA
jgi:hypothetical protein